MRNRIKAVIGKAKRAFLNTALSSKRPKEAWWIIHSVIHPSPRPICADTDKVNRYFIKTTERTLCTLPDKAPDLADLIDSLPKPDRYHFQLRTVSTGQVLKDISLLRSDCSTGVDQIPVKYVKQVGDILTGRLAHIINVYVSLIRSFEASGKLHASHPSLIKSTIQNRTQTIYRSTPRSSSVWCSSKSSTINIDEQSLLLPSVSGFMKGQSTTTVLLGIRDDLIRAMKRGEVIMMVMADYSKAFDTVRF